MGLHITVFQLFGYNFKNVVGDLGDSRFIISIVEYNYQWLSGNYSNYWDGFFMYPDRQVISYSDNLLGVLPIYSLFRVTGADMLTAFQLLLLTCHILNFGLCYWCFNKVTNNKYASAAGAFIFAFSIALNGIHNHPQYTFRFCIPLFFYFLFTYLNTYNRKYLILSSLSLIGQFYLGIYLGYFLLISGGLFVFCNFLFDNTRFKHLKNLLLQSLLAIPILILGLLPLFYFYYKRNQITGYYTDYDYYMQTIPRFSSYFRSFNSSLLWGTLSNTNVNSKYEWLHILFPGALVFISLITSLYFVFKKQKLYMLLVSVIFIFILFTIYFDGHTLYGYLMKIPGIKAARVVSRIVTVLLFFAGWLVCLNIHHFQNRFPDVKKILIIAIPILLFLDNFCLPGGFKTFSKEECRARINSIEQKVIQTPNYKSFSSFAYIPGIKKESQFYHIDAMLTALKLKTKTLNGYSSSAHKQYGPFWRDIDSTSLVGWCEAMALPIDSVLIVK